MYWPYLIGLQRLDGAAFVHLAAQGLLPAILSKTGFGWIDGSV
jgi:hypothetical protein